LIQTRQLAFEFAGGPTLVYPDVDVAQGGVLLLGGPSGSGKSTWLALVAALVKPSQGELTVADQRLVALRPTAADGWRARCVGFLPQKLHLSAALSVLHNLRMAQWAAGRPEDLATAMAALEALGVADLAHRMPAQLSGGQAQRVALARAVLLQPRVILADEPTASLDDAAATEAVGLLLQTAARNDATLVIATHDARVAALIDAARERSVVAQTIQALRLPAASPGA